MTKKLNKNFFTPLSKKVFLSLKEGIIKGDLTPGEKLVEVDIARKMNISRTPVREVLHQLAALGFAKIYPHQGIFVSNFSIEDLKEAVQIRAILEGFATRIVANFATDELIESLEKIIKKMKLCRNKGINEDNVNKYCKCDIEFHNLIIETAKIKRLKDILNNLRDITISFRIISFKIPGNIEDSLKHHIKIVKLIKNRDAKGADLFAQEHVLTS